MTDAPLLVATHDGVTRLTLNRPAAGNALNLELARALREAVIQADADRAVRCVVLTGEGRLFCAGGDISAFGSGGADSVAKIGELADTVHDAISRLDRLQKPVLILVNGPAAGGGLGLALAGDIVLATRSAHFTPAYGAIGLTPDCGVSWRLPRLVGLRRAQEILLTNRRLSATEAETLGLITRAVDDGALAQEGAALAARLAASATAALAVTRNLLIDSFNTGLELQLEQEARHIAAAGGGPEGAEGVAAFLGKRKPDFRQIG